LHPTLILVLFSSIIGLNNSHNDLLIDKIEQIVFVINQVGQIFMVLGRDACGDNLLNSSFGRRLAGVCILLLLCLHLDNDLAVSDHSVAKELNDDY